MWQIARFKLEALLITYIRLSDISTSNLLACMRLSSVVLNQLKVSRNVQLYRYHLFTTSLVLD